MKKLPLLFWVISWLATPVLAQSKPALLDTLFSRLYGQKNFNGNVLIAERGTPIFEKSYGRADEQSHRMLDPESVFELASLSKQFTAMAIVLLQKQGKLSYDDPMARYLPELASYDRITIRHLLHHTSGLPNYTDYFIAHWDKSRIATNRDVIDAFGRVKPPVLFQPGEKFSYINTGYVLLGSIIERVSGQTYAEFLDQRIFKPLGMNHSLVYQGKYKPQKVENYAQGYLLDSLGNKVTPDSYGKAFFTYFLDGMVGDRGVSSTARDLLKWDQALYTDRLISPQDREQIFKNVKTQDGRNTDYGFGWMLRQDEKYGRLAGHSGSWAGYIHYFDRHLDSGKTTILLQNIDTFKNRVAIERVREILYP